MKIRIEEEIYEGTPCEIMEQLWDRAFYGEQFANLDQYIAYMQESFERLTDRPCKLPKGSREEKAKALLAMLAEIDALEVMEDE